MKAIRFLSIILVLSMVLSLVTACQGQDKEDEKEGQQKTEKKAAADKDTEKKDTGKKVTEGKGGLAKVINDDGSLVEQEKNTYDLDEYEAMIGTKLELKEAPTLAEKAAAGELPPVEERLPKNPVVMLPLSESPDQVNYIGSYSDRTMYSNSLMWFIGWAAECNQGAWSPEYGFTAKNSYQILEDISTSDRMEYTFHIREGIRYSDGEEVTSEDAKFFYDAYATDPDVNPGGLKNVKNPDGSFCEFEVIDKYTFKMTWNSKYNLEENIYLLYWLFMFPEHYFEQFHASYQDEEVLQSMVKEKELNSWVGLWKYYATWLCDVDPDRPVLSPWKIKVAKPETVLVYERNPYYWAVDAEGKQLPYIDEAKHETVSDSETALLKVLEGENDIGLYTKGIENMPVIKEKVNKGTLLSEMWPASATNSGNLHFNMNVQDEAKKAVYRDKNFRFGVSHAIDRNTINELFYYGLATLTQPTWSQNSVHYNEAAANAHIEYDTKLASDYLDKAGLDKKDGGGWRLLPDGDRLEINFIARDISNIDIWEFIVDNLKEVGLFCNLRVLDWAAIQNMRSSNELDATFGEADWGQNEGIYYQCINIGVPYNRGFWCPLWTQWYMTNGAEGEEPVPEILKALDYYDEFLEQGDSSSEKSIELMKKMTDLQAENLWVIGTLSNLGYHAMCTVDLKNFPIEQKSFWRGDYGRPAIWFFDD